MDFVRNFRIVIDFYATFLCVGWWKRRVEKWKSEKELFSSDFL